MIAAACARNPYRRCCSASASRLLPTVSICSAAPHLNNQLEAVARALLTRPLFEQILGPTDNLD